MSDSISIKIAGKDYQIQSLTIGQLEKLHVGVVDQTMSVAGWWDQTRQVIFHALSEDHPDITIEHVNKMRLGNLKNARDIRDKILIFAGFVDEPKDGDAKKDPVEGETSPRAE